MFKINKKIVVIVLIIVLIAIVYYIYITNNDSESFSIEDKFLNKIENETKEEKNEEKRIKVHVDGCVVKPGIVEIEEGARISDAIEKAGGLTDEANISKINLAYILEDGIKIHIPSHTETEEEKNMEENYLTGENESQTTSKKTSGKININTASQAELQTLPGIGDSTAQKIINYRGENGKFSSIEDIKNVKGIGQSKYETIKDLITAK